ncbi:SAG family member [Eimeria brunetti]|uniref:SAG family member n=1 Tax=Eimeria brunetti TaxID=51314 RepID=U6L8U6_9EIME|nr:SAG family member [Eimeria brunetti]
MAPFYKAAAAVCLVAVYGLQSEATGPTTTYEFKAVDVDKEAYVAANLVRNGKLAVHINEVAKDDSLVSGLKEKVEPKNAAKGGAQTVDSCDALIKASNLAGIFNHTSEYVESPNYRTLLQAALDAGLGVFKAKGYQNKWNEIWEDASGANLAYLLGSNSTSIGCVIGTCNKVVTPEERSPVSPQVSPEKTVLFCILNPAAENGKAPFDEEYFNELVARTAKLAEMTEDDLKAPSNDGTAAAAIPTVLAAGFVSMLAALSA